jgi:hypothetical protein
MSKPKQVSHVGRFAMESCSTSALKKGNSVKELTLFEQLIISVDSPPWSAVYRTGIGFVAFPAASLLRGRVRSGWMTVPVFVFILLLLRLIPAVVRKLAPFSDAAQAFWFERRQLSKRYDSYQWRKLFWMGVGLASYVVISREFLTGRIVGSLFCLLSGAFGMARWRAIAPRS